MYVRGVVLRVIAILCLVTNCFSDDAILTSKKAQKPGKYPPKVHALFQNRFLKKLNHNGVWSAWGSWSECSRSCGGGVMVQTRYCINRPSDNRFIQKPRKRRLNSQGGCIGLYKRIHLCNPQDCALGAADFRREQCSTYNMKKYKGKSYIWEPFLGAEEECALNCRPTGMNFYATLNKTVIDGTPCSQPITSTGRPAPHGTRGVCVSGICKSVDSRGVIGSIDDNNSECPACTQGLCRSINGIYTRSNLPPGYSLITQIPKGACQIIVQQMKHSRNFLALKKVNSTFVLNGEWKFSTASHSFEGAGTRFTYVKQDNAAIETITSEGPLQSSVELYLVTYQPNLGVKYGYLLPNNVDRQTTSPSNKVSHHSQYSNNRRKIAPPSILRPNLNSNTIESRKLDRSLHSNQQDDPKTLSHHHQHRQRRLRRRFTWKISGISACSKSCGGGIQTTVVSCVREPTQTPVPDRRCAHLEKPNANPIRCNIQDCPPKWSGFWTSCSVTCGTGVQRYLTQCKQELNTGREVIVDDVQCSGRPKPLVKTQTCTQVACDLSSNEVTRIGNLEGKWLVGEWSTCSVSCGTGHRSRSVTCSTANCRADLRPSNLEYCTLPSCDLQPQTHKPSQSTDISTWLVTEWSKCSEDCGTGIQTRYAVCGRNTCDISSKPDSTRDCSSEKQCGGQWFAGPWGECSDSCSGQAHQNREVICIVKLRGQSRITNDITCPNHLKPPNVQPCSGTCDPLWFAGDWGVCENCPNGVQRRTVRCMDVNGVPSNRCRDSTAPTSKKSCNCQRREVRDKYKPVQDQPIDQNCVDQIKICYLAVQARLCQYPYYKSQCCVACKKALQDHLLQ